MKLKKIILVFVVIGLSIGFFLLCDITINGGRGSPAHLRDALSGQARVLSGDAEWTKGAIVKMVNTGSAPENLTFTGEKSPNDVFGSGKMDFELMPPLPGTCSSECPAWKFLPAVNKNHGWYVYGAGTSATDIIAYMPDITLPVCRELQKEAGYKNIIPPKQASASFDPEKPGAYLAAGGSTTIKSQDNTLDGQLQGCFDNHIVDGANSYSYYYVLQPQ